MSCFAMTPETFDRFRDSEKKVFSCLDPKYINAEYITPHFQTWADAVETDPPFLNIYTDDNTSVTTCIILYKDAFVTGNIYVLYDEDIAITNSIRLTAYTPSQLSEPLVA